MNDGVNFAHRQIFSTTAYSLVLTLQRNHRMTVYPGTDFSVSISNYFLERDMTDFTFQTGLNNEKNFLKMGKTDVILSDYQ